MKFKQTLWSLCDILMLTVLTTHVNAQVTIGSSTKPIDGALLDLKQYDDNEAKTGGRTAIKGLGMPRVKLTKIDDITIDITGVDATNKDEHVGLMVYNTNSCLTGEGHEDGLYVWTGERWIWLGQGTMAAGVYKVTDPRDNEVYLARNFGAVAGDWMLENIRYDPIAHPDPVFINYVHTAESAPVPPSTAKHFAYVEGNENPYIAANHPSAEWEFKKRNGLFYTWAGATNNENLSTVNQAQGQVNEQTESYRGICPVGWHVPSDREWNDLERQIYNNAELYSSYSEADRKIWQSWDPTWETSVIRRPDRVPEAHGTAMRSPCPPFGGEHHSFHYPGKSLSPAQGGFYKLQLGNGAEGYMGGYSSASYIWSSSAEYNRVAWYRMVYGNESYVRRDTGNNNVLMGVRCKRNEPGIQFDRLIIHLASGHDARGNVTEVLAKLTNEFPTKTTSVSIVEGTANLAGMRFSPALETTLPAFANYDYKVKPVAMTIVDDLNPWQSHETYLNFKTTNDAGVEVQTKVTLNQTNYIIQANNNVDAAQNILIKNMDQISYPIKSNTQWKLTVTDTHNILSYVSNTGPSNSVAGAVNTQGGANSTISYFSPKADAGTKYKTATLKYEDFINPKRAKDVTVTVMQCQGTEDVSLLTSATPAQTSGANIWGAAVVRHEAKPNTSKPGENIYEEFTSADFGLAGRWMTTNLSAKAYDGVAHSAGRALVQHDSGTTNRYNVAVWAYPNNNRAIVNNELASDEYKANPHLGLLYTGMLLVRVREALQVN